MREAKSSRFLYSFWQLRQSLLSRLEPALKAHHDLSLAELFLLHSLLSQDCNNPSELIERLGIPAHGISRKLEALERRGLILRQLDKEDKRKRHISITAKGETLLAESFHTLDSEVGDLLSVLNEQDLDMFLQLLDKLTSNSASSSSNV
ncbi:MAG: MarR family winged helix-turn-helix transcriptional regulator [Deinococcales bacterium]